MKFKHILYLGLPPIVCLLVGFVGSRAQELSLLQWYPTLVKPSLTPPNIAFPIAWTTLYILMGVSIGLVLVSKIREKRLLVTLFCVQLLLNFLWSILFFKMQNPVLGMVDIILLDAVVVWYAVRSYRPARASSILFWPYVAWLLFATYLNIYIVIYN